VIDSDIPCNSGFDSTRFGLARSSSKGDLNEKFLRDSILMSRPLWGLIRPALLSGRPSSSLGVRGPDRGETNSLFIDTSLNPDIPTSCFPWAHGPTFPISNDSAAVLDLRNNWRSPPINPDRFRTTSAIIESLILPCATV
jgi:hypothetical protein